MEETEKIPEEIAEKISEEPLQETEGVEDTTEGTTEETIAETTEEISEAPLQETEEDEKITEVPPLEVCREEGQEDIDKGVEKANRAKERRSTLRFFAIILVIVAIFFGVRTYWVKTFSGVKVDGSSMSNTLTDGDWLLMKRTTKAKRGDIIVVHVENYEEIQRENEGLPSNRQLKYLIKRLIAVEGDSLYCIDGQIYIRYKGEEEYAPLKESYAYYGDEKVADANRQAYDFAEYTVGEGEIFFLGDNRKPGGSVDSRYKEGYSHLKEPGRLYRRSDIEGVVPKWALKRRALIEKIFF